MAEGLDVGFVDQMKTVTKDINNSLPTSITGSALSGGSGSTLTFDDMVNAFKEALTEMKIEMDSDEMGKFVDKTVTNLIYD